MRFASCLFAFALLFQTSAYALPAINQKNYEAEVLQSKLPVIIDAYAPYCGHCRDMAPIFDDLSKQFKGQVKFFTLNVEKEAVFSDVLGVQVLPTFLFIKAGVVVNKATGAMTEEELKQKIEQYLIKENVD